MRKNKIIKTSEFYVNTFMRLNFCEWLDKQDQLWLESKIAEYLNQAADSIANIVGKKTVVILGRDAWALVPLLRHRGIRTQYFLYSRLQIGDESTRQAWLREVPRRSYVIDTGYEGSIIDDIKTFDPSVKGILLSSSGKYPELEVKEKKLDRSRIVGDIEYSPKLISRATGYRGPFAMATPERDRNADIGGQTNPNLVRQQNQELLRAAGLPDDMVKKYQNFSGISPKDRLGHDDYLSHWKKIERGRQGKEKKRLGYYELYEIAEKSVKKGRPWKWDWDSLPSRTKSALATRASKEYDNITAHLEQAKRELQNVQPWDTEHLNEIQEKIKRRQKRLTRFWKFVEPVYNRYYGGGY